MITMKFLKELSKLEHRYKERFGAFPQVSHPDTSREAYMQSVREALASGEPIANKPLPDGELS